MKKLFILLVAIFFTTYLSAQTSVVFHEDFELPSLGDSLISSSNPVGGNPWAISTHLKNSGFRSDSSRVQDQKTTYLTTNSFSTLGYSKVSLKFAQICKLLIQDGGTLQYSINGGSNWLLITDDYYQGNGVMSVDRFNEYSYSTLWKSGDTLTMPTNSWWTNETFDLSALISNQADVKLRFCITDGGNVGGEGRYGWLLDDITVFAANNEIDAPKITFKTPIIQDSVSNTGPFQIKTFITDASAITTANLIYSVNGGNNINVAMTHTDSTYIGEIPSFTYNNIISYKIVAIDQYGNQSISNSYSFIIKKAPLIVEIGSGTTNNYYAPIYISSATNTSKYSFNASLYNASEINTTGYIKSIAWNKANSESYTLGNASFKIYLKEVSSSTAPSTYTDYTAALNGATLVYSNLAQSITASTGWDTYNFNVDSFLYGGQNNLMVFVEFYRPGNATGAIKYYYTSLTGRAYTFSGTSIPPTTTSSNYLPNIQLGVSSTNFLCDAGISEIYTPSGVVISSAPVPVKVRVKNYGTEILTKTNVHWALDGVYQGSSVWTGNLAQDMISSEFHLGNTLLATGPHVITSWTKLPNDSIDNFANNDTVNGSVFSCSQILNGVYTVGNASATFPTFADALSGLSNCGINGPVVFKIKSGTYNQQLTIPAISGSSNVNTITFESESGNKDDVIFSYAATATADNWVIKLDGSNYLKIKNITIKPLSATYGRGIELALNASNNTIEGCKIEMQVASATGVSGIYSGTTLEQYNTFKNNEILNGYHGIFISGTSATVLEKGNIIVGNIISGFYYYGISSTYQDSVIINSNIIENGSNATSVYGIYAHYNDNLLSISKNKVYVHSSGTSANYGIDVSNSDNTAIQPGIIANNFITQSGTTGIVYGLYSITSTYQQFLYNSVNITSGSATTGRALYTSSGSNIDLYNNILSNTGGGYAYYIGTVAAINNSNYNDLYSTGASLAYWGAAKTNLAELQSTSGKDANSISVIPGFISLTDLHVNNSFLNNVGTPIPSVIDDFDGDIRNLNTPDIGADEFQIIANDGGITELISPTLTCSGTAVDIIVKLKNFGVNTLNSVDINWTINGVSQPVVNFAGSLANLGTANVLISNYTFLSGINYNMKFWVENPNNLADDNTANDTLTINNFQTSLSGAYTIGNSSADYTSINLAVADLILKGICGPTVFNILPGNYNGNVEIPEINGSSSINTITFKSSNGDSTSVILNYSSTGATDNYVIKLNGADNIIIKNISIQNNGGTFSRVIELSSSANNNKILNNVIKSSVSTSTTSAGIYNGSGLDQFNIFRNNIITNGYYGIYNYGTSSSVLEKGNIIDRNTITGFYSSGIYSYYQDSVTITSNTIENGSNAGTAYGIYPQYNDNLLSISNNKVYVHGSGTNYGIYIYYCDNTAAQPGIIANNFISQSGSTGTVYGLGNYNSTYHNYYYNSVNITSGSSSAGHAFYLSGGSNVNLNNNIFSNTGGGYAYNISTISAINNSDYNNFYTTGNSLALWTNAKADLTTLQASSGKDLNSISTNPTFFSISDLHTDNTLIFAKGTPISVITEDIDGNLRNSVSPCIGADEYSVLSNDAKVKALYTLGKLPKDAGSPHIIKSLIQNKGINTLFNINVNLTISGSNTFTNSFTIDTLFSGETDTISFTGFTPLNYGSENVKVSIPADDLLSNNELSYLQIVTDTVFSYADTSKANTHLGFNSEEGLFLSKYYMNGSKTVPSVNAFISNSNTIGQKLYGVILNSNGVILDTTYTKTITATDTNKWVKFDFVNPLQTTTVNDYFYIGIAQIAGSIGGYYPLGCQSENPTRNNTFFTSNGLAGGSLTEVTQFGRFMIDAIIGNSTSFDASIIEIASPNSGCGLTNETVTVNIQNGGLATIYGGQNVLKAFYALELNGVLLNTISQQVTDTILPAQSKLFSFTTPVNLTASIIDSNYKIVTWVKLLNDPLITNDTLVKALLSKHVPVSPTVSSPVNINYANSVTLTASAVDLIEWHANYNDNIVIATGTSFTTPLLFDTTTYWVRTTTSEGNSMNNLALSAVASHSGGGSNDYGPAKYNDGVIPAYGTATVGLWGWTSGNGWIEFTWATPQKFDKVVFYKDQRELSSCTFQYWDGSAYIDFLSYNNNNFDDSVTFPAVSSTKIRFSGIYSSDGSPSFREIQVFEAMVLGCQSTQIPLKVITNNIPALDAGIDEITSPVGSATTGVNTPVTVIINNWGATSLTSATIGWSIDGVAQTPVIWTGNIISGQTSSPYQIANIPFNGGIHTIKAWTYNPNNMADLYTINDTASTTFDVCMIGNFTIGTTGNFHSFNEALQAIDIAGFCGSVIFDVLPGTYNEAINIDQIPNAGPNATITFRSQNGNNNSVILTSDTGSYVVKLNNADYIRFEKITIKATANVATTVELSGGANYNVFDGNNIKLQASSSATERAINSTSTFADNYNQFINNNISGGYYGIYWYGSSSIKKVGNIFSNNNITDFYNTGLYLYYNDSATVSGNVFANASNSTTVYGLNSNYTDKSIFTKNKVHLSGSSTAYGMYFYYNNTTSGNSLVANNFVSQSIGSSGVSGINNSYSNNMSYYNNSVNITDGSTSAYAFYSTSGLNNNVVNNNFSNTGGGYAYYVSTITGINISNYNNLFATGTNLAYWSAAKTDLPSLIAVSNKDSNSVSVNPDYASVTDLHIINFNLNGKATPLASVTDDIDGDTRNLSIPDIGADEFNLPDNDAGIIAISQPNSPVAPGMQTVKAIIKNFGALNLTSANIQWMVNGILQTPHPWTGTIISGSSDTISIGSYNFTNGVASFKVWTNMPNGVVDQFTQNDTLNTSITTCVGPLTGNYTIGTGGANYPNIYQAVQSLTYCGISGPVVFNLQSGVYNEQVVIPSINGTSSINTVTFKSQNNDSSSVIITYNPSLSSANYVIKLNGANYIKFKNVSVINSTQSNLGRVIELTNQANNNEFSNNVIQTEISTSSTTAGIYSYNTKDEMNVIANNFISGGYYGIYFYGISSSAGSKEKGNTISNNVIKDFYYYGLYLYYQDSITVSGNKISNAAISGTAYGIASYYCDNNSYQKNKIILNSSSTAYGMYLSYNNNTSGSGLIANNFISQSLSTGTVYGSYSTTSSNIKYYHNSINITQGGTTNRSVYFTGGTGNELKNNSIVNAGGGFAIYAASTTSISISDYNNLFTTGINLGYWSTADTSLVAWQTASGQDSNSTSLTPDYISNTDLHVYSIALNDKGTPLSIINDDIDGQPRNATTPDIGADEFTPLPIDIGVSGIYGPDNSYSQVGSSAVVKCIIKNYGSTDVSNFNISYKAGNAIVVTMPYSGTLIANTIDSVEFTTPFDVIAGPLEIMAYTTIANDGNSSNDTSKIIYFGVPVKGIPYAENFDGSTEEWFQTGGSMQWQKGIPNASVINNAHSSPNVWATVLNGNYINNCYDYLYTPIFNNSVFKADTLKFWFRMDAENEADGGRIEYKDSQDNWNILGNLATIDTNSVNWYNASSQAMWTGTGTGWQQAKYAVSKLNTLGNSVQFRFIFHSNQANTNNGWAIDDFELTLKQIDNDAGVIAITDPNTSLLGDTVYPTITVKNYGLNALTSIPVKYTVNGQSPVSETINTIIAPGASINYTFNQYFKVLTLPTYTIKAYTTVIGDYYTGSDTITKTVNVSPALKDVGILSIISPADMVSSGSIITVTIRIKNYGSLPVTSVPVSYKRGTQPAQNAIWTGTALNYGDSATFAFPVTFTVPLGSAFTFSAYTSLAGDAFDLNDKITKSITITSIPASAGMITSISAYGGDTICFPTGSTTPVIVTYTVPSISNATNYVWNYTGTNASYNDTTAANSVTVTFNPNATDGILTVYGYNTLGNGSTSPDFAIDVIQNCSVGIEDESMDNFWLSQNMPNPTNNNTIIEYNIPQQGDIIFNIVNMIGQNVYNFHETKESGKHNININVNSLPDGIYYYSLTFKGKRLVKKMVVNK